MSEQLNSVGTSGKSLSVAIEAGERSILDQALANPYMRSADLDSASLIDAAQKGAVWLQINHTDTVSSRPIRVRELDGCTDMSAELLININVDVLQESPGQPKLKLQERNYSIWHKPAGVLCQGTRWGDHCSLARIVELESDRPVHLVHRLDKAASGLILLAHTRPAAKALSALFAKRRVRKIYQATVVGKVDWSLPHVIEDEVDGKNAKTIVLSVAVDAANSTSKISVQIETGRKHQIRQHLSQHGYPILGDRLFDPQREHVEDLQLMATELGFECPFSGKEILVRSA